MRERGGGGNVGRRQGRARYKREGCNVLKRRCPGKEGKLRCGEGGSLEGSSCWARRRRGRDRGAEGAGPEAEAYIEKPRRVKRLDLEEV